MGRYVPDPAAGWQYPGIRVTGRCGRAAADACREVLTRAGKYGARSLVIARDGLRRTARGRILGWTKGPPAAHKPGEHPAG